MISDPEGFSLLKIATIGILVAISASVMTLLLAAGLVEIDRKEKEPCCVCGDL